MDTAAPSPFQVTAAISFGRRASRRSGSTIVPGVTIRTILRATRVRPFAGASVCSLIATFFPAATSRARYGSSACCGMPHIGASTSLSLWRAVRTRPRRGAAYVGVLEEHLVEVAEAVEKEGVSRLPLESPVLLEHGRRAHVEAGMLASRGGGGCSSFRSTRPRLSRLWQSEAVTAPGRPGPCRRTPPRAFRSRSRLSSPTPAGRFAISDRVAVLSGPGLLHGTARGARVRARARAGARHPSRPRPDVRRRRRGQARARGRRLRPRRRPGRRARGPAHGGPRRGRDASASRGPTSRPPPPREGIPSWISAWKTCRSPPPPGVSRRATRPASRALVYGRPSAAEEKRRSPGGIRRPGERPPRTPHAAGRAPRRPRRGSPRLEASLVSGALETRVFRGRRSGPPGASTASPCAAAHSRATSSARSRGAKCTSTRSRSRRPFAARASLRRSWTRFSPSPPASTPRRSTSRCGSRTSRPARFTRGSGFTEAGRRARYYLDGEDALVMVRKLRGRAALTAPRR